jgi:hypothetical protein
MQWCGVLEKEKREKKKDHRQLLDEEGNMQIPKKVVWLWFCCVVGVEGNSIAHSPAS